MIGEEFIRSLRKKQRRGKSTWSKALYPDVVESGAGQEL